MRYNESIKARGGRAALFYLNVQRLTDPVYHGEPTLPLYRQAAAMVIINLPYILRDESTNKDWGALDPVVARRGVPVTGGNLTARSWCELAEMLRRHALFALRNAINERDGVPFQERTLGTPADLSALELADQLVELQPYFAIQAELPAIDWRAVYASIEVECTEAEATGGGAHSPESQPGRQPRLDLLLDDDGGAIVRIIRSDKSTDDKYREICGSDLRLVPWDSEKMGDLLGVSGAAVRQTKFWKVDRPVIIAANA